MHKQSHPPAHYLTLKCTVLCDPELPILWSPEIDDHFLVILSSVVSSLSHCSCMAMVWSRVLAMVNKSCKGWYEGFSFACTSQIVSKTLPLMA